MKTFCKTSLLYLFLLSFVFCPLTTHAQEIVWQKTLGGSGMDWGAFSSTVANDGGVILVGITDSNDGDVSGNHGDQDVWIVKLDSLGNIDWQRCYGGDTADVGSSIAAASDGGYIACGFAYSNNGDVSGNHGGADFWVIKIDSIGNLQWQKCYGGTAHEDAHSIKPTSDGGYIVGGTTFSNNGDVSGLHGYRDFWVIKIDSIGNLQWQKCLGGTNDEFAYSVDTTADGGYVIAGLTYSNDGDVTGYNGAVDYWVVKLNSVGNLVWQKCLGGSSGWENAHSVKLTSDGGFILNGETISTNGNVSGNHGAIDYWVVKLDSNGTMQWQSCLGGTGSERGQYVSQTSDGGYLVAGSANSSDGQVSNFHGGAGDFWIAKLDGGGSLIWQRCFGGSGEDRPYAIHQLSDVSYIATGMTMSNDGDVTNNHGGYSDFWVLKFTSIFNLISGALYIDLNSNGIRDTIEPELVGNKIIEQNTSRIGFSQNNGNYYVAVLDTGNYSVIPDSLNYYNPVPSMHNAYFSALLQNDSLNDFAFQPAGVFSDLRIAITPLTPFRSGFNASYVMQYENVGTTTLNASIIFYLSDTNYSYISSSINPSLVTADSVMWNNISLAPFQEGDITVTVYVKPGLPLGTQLNAFCLINPWQGDATVGDNYGSWKVFTVGSFDPNDILVDENILTTVQLAAQPYLEYIIRFQNTGNDTAFTVKILNPIDTNKLELNTIEFVASSHPVNLKWTPWERNMEFKFDNILLPDSNINEPLSHGYVRYRIKPKSNLVAGDTIKNNAAIYFDFNSAVITNTAITKIVLPSGLTPLSAGEGLRFYPNPASGTITIAFTLQTPQKALLKIYDVNGRCVATLADKKFISGENRLTWNVRNLENGIYFLRFQTETIIENKKLVIQR